MSYSYYFNIGPYVYVKNPTEIRKHTVEHEGCSDHGSHQNKFCGECGKPKEKYEFEEECKKSLFQVLCDLDIEEFHCISIDPNILLPNFRMENQMCIHLGDDFGSYDIPDKEKAIEELKEKFSSAINKLKEYFGEENIELKFGVVHYYS